MISIRRLGYLGQRLSFRNKSVETSNDGEVDAKSFYYPNTSFGIKERSVKPDEKVDPQVYKPYPPFPDGKNPKTGEVGGPAGPEPTRFGDWERKGRVTDF